MIVASGGESLAKAAIVRVLVGALAASSALVLIATKGRHPGWLCLLAAALLGWLGQAAL